MLSTKFRGANRLIISQIGRRVTLRIFEVKPEFVAHNSMFPLQQKLLVLVRLFRVDYVGAYKCVQPFCLKPRCWECVFFPHCLPKRNKVFIQMILVLTNNFLKLRSFSKTMQMFVSAANFLKLADLQENLAKVFFRKLSIAFLAFCV